MKKEGKLDSSSIFGGANLPWTSKQAAALNNKSKPTTTGEYQSLIIFFSRFTFSLSLPEDSSIDTPLYACICLGVH
jgi:hypothetical protein